MALPPVAQAPEGRTKEGLIPSKQGRGWGQIKSSQWGHGELTFPVDGGGAELCPCSIATGTPQSFPVASWSGTLAPASESPAAAGVRCLPAPTRQV